MTAVFDSIDDFILWGVTAYINNVINQSFLQSNKWCMQINKNVGALFKVKTCIHFCKSCNALVIYKRNLTMQSTFCSDFHFHLFVPVTSRVDTDALY